MPSCITLQTPPGFTFWHHASNVSGCRLVEAVRAHGGDRYYSYLCRVPEMVFQGWFSVSALVFAIDSSSSDKFSMLLLSVASTCASSIISFYETAACFPSWRQNMLTPSYSPTPNHVVARSWMPTKLVVCMSFHFVGFLAICVRLVGVWACNTHDFLISRISCRHE